MVEQGIYFALGCIVTALAAMMFGPVYWRRALRLTRKRLQLQVPLSMQEILAERDQLRAEFAVERLRVEQAMEAVQASKAADMAEVGRRAMEATALRDEIATLVSKGNDTAADLDRLTRDVAEAGAEVGTLKAALEDAYANVEKWRQRAYQKAEDLDRLRDEGESQRATIAGLKTRAMALEMRLTDAQRGESVRLKSAEDVLRARLETAMGQATRHETSAISLRRECDDAKAHMRTLEDELEGARARETALQQQVGQTSSKPVHDGDAEPVEGSDEDLRSSIHALGLAVAMMTRRKGAERAAADKGSASEPVTALARENEPSAAE